jgi:hypothetical protein
MQASSVRWLSQGVETLNPYGARIPAHNYIKINGSIFIFQCLQNIAVNLHLRSAILQEQSVGPVLSAMPVIPARRFKCSHADGILNIVNKSSIQS